MTNHDPGHREAAEPSRFTRSIIRGMAWTLSTSLSTRIVGLVGTLLLARFLAPAEYGEVSAAAILALTANSITTLGMGTYLVSTRDVSRADVYHASVLFLAVGVVALAAISILSEPLGAWSEVEHVGRYMPILVIGTAIDRLTYVPSRMLVRKLRFRRISVANALSELTFTAVSLIVAALGGGGMAIAWGNLARSVVRFVGIVPGVDRREWLEPHPLQLATFRRIVDYGATAALASIPAFAMRRWDNLLVSRYFGVGTMGAYNYAYNLADTPAVAIGEPMSDVVAASLPHVDGPERSRELVRSFTMLALIMLPLGLGLAATASTVVATFFDAKWASVGTMLMILAALTATRPLAHVVHAYLFACQRQRAVLALEVASLVAIMAAIPTIGRAGILWTCGAVAAVFTVRTLASVYTVHRLDGTPISRFLVPLVRPVAACAVMVAAIAAVRPALRSLSPGVQLAIEVGVGVVAYAGGALLLFRTAAVELIAMVRAAVKKK